METIFPIQLNELIQARAAENNFIISDNRSTDLSTGITDYTVVAYQSTIDQSEVAIPANILSIVSDILAVHDTMVLTSAEVTLYNGDVPVDTAINFVCSDAAIALDSNVEVKIWRNDTVYAETQTVAVNAGEALFNMNGNVTGSYVVRVARVNDNDTGFLTFNIV